MHPPTLFADRLRLALRARGLSQRALERAAGLNNGHVSLMLKRPGDKVTPDTLRRLSQALAIKHEWLATGLGERDAPPTDDEPVSSKRPLTDPASVSRLIDDAFVDGRHKPSDADAVREMIVRGAQLQADETAPELVRVLLDAAARLRVRGAAATSEGILADLAARVLLLERQPVSRSG